MRPASQTLPAQMVNHPVGIVSQRLALALTLHRVLAGMNEGEACGLWLADGGSLPVRNGGAPILEETKCLSKL